MHMCFIYIYTEIDLALHIDMLCNLLFLFSYFHVIKHSSTTVMTIQYFLGLFILKLDLFQSDKCTNLKKLNSIKGFIIII